jgi:transposase InsO family protein
MSHRGGSRQIPREERHGSVAQGFQSSSEAKQNRAFALDPQERSLGVCSTDQILARLTRLENYALEDELEAAITVFVEHNNRRRYHESLGNLTPVDVYFVRGPPILAERKKIKAQIIHNRRLIQHRQAT